MVIVSLPFKLHDPRLKGRKEKLTEPSSIRDRSYSEIRSWQRDIKLSRHYNVHLLLTGDGLHACGGAVIADDPP